MCVCAYSWECMQVQGMLPSPPHPPTQPKGMCLCAYSWECMQVQGMLPSPAHPPTHPPYKGMCVCAYSWECMQVQGMLPSPAHPPTHPPTQPKGMCVCVRTVGNVCKSKVCYHPHPTHPPTTHPTQRYVCTDESPKTRCVYRWVRFVCADEAFGVCVQMSQICVRRWVPYQPSSFQNIMHWTFHRIVMVCSGAKNAAEFVAKIETQNLILVAPK